MTEFHRFRGNPHFDATALRRAVTLVLENEPFFAGRPRAQIEASFDALISAGVGHPSSYADGYGQVLALNVGLLLRMAGANVEAIRQEIARRDVAGLETVSEALIARMKVQASSTTPAANPADEAPDAARMHPLHAPPPEPATRPTLEPPSPPETPEEIRALGQVASNPPPTRDEDAASVLGVGSTPNVGEFLTSSPALDLSGRPAPVPAPANAIQAASEANAPEVNAPLRYLRDLVDDRVSASLGARPSHDAPRAPAPASAPAADEQAAPVKPPRPRRIPLLEGVTLELDAAAATSVRDAGDRAQLLAALHAALERTLGG